MPQNGENAAEHYIAPITRQLVWDSMLDAARMHRYADAMERKYAKQRHWVRIMLSLAASGGIVTFLGRLPDAASVLFGLMVGAVVAVDFAMDYSSKLAKLMYAKMECSALLAEWEELWVDMQTYRCGEGEARRRNKGLLDRLDRAIAPMVSDVRTDLGVNEETTASAYSDLSMRFAGR